jgi:TonB-linked SusC/RagA family outer membrane protein
MKQIFILLIFGVAVYTANAQINVSGRVIDATNEPLAGVSVVVESTTFGTITDADGKYSISVPNASSVLRFSYLGYKEQKMTVGDRTEINVKMEENASLLDEVVVVGYGTQKKVNVTGAVSSINFEDQVASRPITSVSSSLAGLAAGLTVLQSSGQPGADGATLRIRGISTLNDNNPLILVDGMVASMDDVNPNDIASISILKDGASAAIYGARAGSGVVLITTKRGNKSGKTNIVYSGRMSIMNPINLPRVVSNYADFMEYHNESAFQSGSGQIFDPVTDIQFWRDKAKNPNELNQYGYPNYVAYPNTDWIREVYNENSLLHDHNVSISGNTGNARYLMSMGYVDNSGLVDYSDMKRINLRINLESDVTKWLTVGARIYGNKDDRGRIDFDSFSGYGTNSWIMGVVPGIYPLYDGVYGTSESVNEKPSATNIRQRLDSYANGRNERVRLNATTYAKFKIIEGLTWDVNLHYERRWENTDSWTNAEANGQFSFSRNEKTGSVLPNTELNTSNSRYDLFSYTLEHLLNYAGTFAEDHDVTALLGFQEYYWTDWSNGGTRKGLIDESIHTLSSGTEVTDAWGSRKDRASRALFGRLTYAYKSRYLFEFNMRYDAHSRFNKDYRWGIYPSVSVGWRITEESFMENTRDWLNNLKLRLSWGLNGNYGGDSVGDYEYQGVYNAAKYPLGGKVNEGLAQIEINNPKLSWERSDIRNIGIDARFLKNRLTLELDAYYKLTDGILYRITIPGSAGNKTAPRMNLAEVTNKGFEVTLGWNDRIGEFNYNVSGNLGYTGNVVSHYKGPLKQGWVEENGEMVWKTNLGDVSQGGDQRVIEERRINEWFLRTRYQGNETYYGADGTVNPDGGPKDGMIRTEADMQWAKDMVAAGYTFYGFNATTVGARNGLYYGDYLYADNNGDKTYGSDNDRTLIGAASTPRYSFGFQLQGEWKGIDLGVSLAGAAGFKLYFNEKGYNSSLLQLAQSLSLDVAENHYFYNPDNPNDPRTNINAKYPRLTQDTQNSSIRINSDYFLFKADYLKVKNVTIGYTLPKKLTNKINAEKIRLYVSGENLLTFTSFPGVDPEQGAQPKYQPVKHYAIGLNVSF